MSVARNSHIRNYINNIWTIPVIRQMERFVRCAEMNVNRKMLSISMWSGCIKRIISLSVTYVKIVSHWKRTWNDMYNCIRRWRDRMCVICAVPLTLHILPLRITIIMLIRMSLNVNVHCAGNVSVPWNRYNVICHLIRKRDHISVVIVIR